jgi:molybdopterin molybdotransferase
MICMGIVDDAALHRPHRRRARPHGGADARAGGAHLHRRDAARGRRRRDHCRRNCERDRRSRDIRPGIKRGANTRRAGEDVARGALALAAGRRLGPADLGLLAALGFVEVPVRRKLTVALLSTGDEVRAPGELLRRGRSRRQPLHPGRAARAPRVDVSDRGIVRDDRPG